MTYEKFIQLVRNPDSIEESHQGDLRELIEKYPYFGISRWLYLKSLHVSNSIYYNSELKKTALFAANRRNLFFFIHPEEKVKASSSLKEERASMTGSYFDMIDILESKDERTRGSLQAIAERLKTARKTMQAKSETLSKASAIKPTEKKESIEKLGKDLEIEANFNEYEAQAKAYIKEKKYEEAIEILEKLYLINPKKSVYFADQIRFLKKVIKI